MSSTPPPNQTVKEQYISDPSLEVHDLMVSYRKKPVLWNINFKLPKAKLIGIIGPNGAGKSTLIKTIMNLIEPRGGTIQVFGKGLEEVRDEISYVPQTETVDWDFPASVMDVVMMGRYAHRGFFRRYNSEDKAIAKKCLETVGMLPYAKRQISQLSGGQQQRVFVARSLAQEASLYFMDEPMAGIDASTEASILKLLQEMRNDGKTILVVHHDLQSAYEHFDWIIFLNTRLIAYGPTEEVFTEKIIQQTYGGTPAILSSVAEIIKQKGLNIH